MCGVVLRDPGWNTGILSVFRVGFLPICLVACFLGSYHEMGVTVRL